MEKEYQLRFHVDQDGYEGICLYKTNSLLEMDKYIQRNFQSSEEVRIKYQDEISETSLHYRVRIIDENNRNKNNRTGMITLFSIEKNLDGKITSSHKLPVLYKGKKGLMSFNKCIRKIKAGLLNDDTLLKELQVRKGYLLSQNEKVLLARYFNRHIIKDKEDAITFFLQRIRKGDLEYRHYYFRSLMNLCGLYEEKIQSKIGTIQDVEVDESTLSKPKNKPQGWSQDAYFNDLISNGNFDELHKLYDIDQIERDSNLLDPDTFIDSKKNEK